MTGYRTAAAKLFFACAIFFYICAAPCAQAAVSNSSLPNPLIAKARVISIQASGTKTPPSSNLETPFQTLKVEVISGPLAQSFLTFDNFLAPLGVGDVFYLSRYSDPSDPTDTSATYSVYDYYRIPIIILLGVIFVALVFMFGGIQGVRGIASLCGSMFLIFYLLIPGILQGYSPVLVSILIASLIIVGGSYITHGFNKTTTAAMLGMIVTVILVGVCGYVLTLRAHLSGGFADGSDFVAGYNAGAGDLVSVLFGGIIISLLGVLYDIAIGQAVVVEELLSAAKDAISTNVYRKAIRVGREHIGALVNTLAIAYVGFSLPLMLSLHFWASTFGIELVINSNQIATEIIRILLSSIGLVLAVPITTLISVRLLRHHF